MKNKQDKYMMVALRHLADDAQETLNRAKGLGKKTKWLGEKIKGLGNNSKELENSIVELRREISNLNSVISENRHIIFVMPNDQNCITDGIGNGKS